MFTRCSRQWGLSCGRILVSQVFADGEDYAALKKLITENRVGERVKLDANDKLTIPTDPKGGVAYRLESVDIDGSTGAMTTTSHGVARFHLPATDAHENKTAIDGNGIAIYAGTSYHIALDAAQDGFSAYVAINDSAAPTRYEFDYDLPSGFKLSEDGAGGIEILNSENEIVGDIAPPWAVDANGAGGADSLQVGRRRAGSDGSALRRGVPGGGGSSDSTTIVRRDCAGVPYERSRIEP